MKNLCSGSQCGGFQFLLILNLWGISFYDVVVFGLGKNLLFKSVLVHCFQVPMYHVTTTIKVWWGRGFLNILTKVCLFLYRCKYLKDFLQVVNVNFWLVGVKCNLKRTLFYVISQIHYIHALHENRCKAVNDFQSLHNNFL